MKFACLGYFEPHALEATSKVEQDAMIEECFAYDDELVNQGHWINGGQALQSTATAKTLRWKDGKVVVTDGPFAETKEVLGGIGVLEARDLEHAVELMSKHPGIRIGPFEIRPIDEEALERLAALDAKHAGPAAVAQDVKADTAEFACLGYIQENSWEAASESEQAARLEECIAFDTARYRDGHWISGMRLQGTRTAKTVRSKRNKVVVTDGPFAETKEQLGGLIVSRFRDMHHAIEVFSTHPSLRLGVVMEIRPIDAEMNARWEARRDQFQSV
jgi:hypothetical protein